MLRRSFFAALGAMLAMRAEREADNPRPCYYVPHSIIRWIGPADDDFEYDFELEPIFGDADGTIVVLSKTTYVGKPLIV